MQAKEEKEEKIADEPTWQELGQAKYVNLGTWRKSGVCVNTPVWGAPLNGAVYAFSELKAGKVKRLRNSARSRLAVCDVRGGLKGDWYATQAYLVEDEAEERAAKAAFTGKYGLVMRLTDLASKLSGRYHNRIYLRIGRDTG